MAHVVMAYIAMAYIVMAQVELLKAAVHKADSEARWLEVGFIFRAQGSGLRV